MKGRILTGLLLIFLITGFDQLATLATLSSSSVIRVPEDYPTIQKAINAAKPGDTILVSPGIYYESIVIDKPISLIGESRENTFIMGSEVGKRGEGGVIISISSVTVKVSGFRIGDPEVPHMFGIVLENSTKSVISNNIIFNNYYWGIWLRSSNNSIIENNILRMNEESGLALTSFSSGNVIKDNICYANGRFGIQIQSSNNNTIKNNIIKANGEAGVLLISSNNTQLINNTIILNGMIGIGLESSSYNEIFYNLLTANVWGLSVLGKSTENKVYMNNIEGNIKFGAHLHDGETLDLSLNWWGDKTGPYHPTENPHGLGDTVYSDPWFIRVNFKPWADARITEAPAPPKFMVSNFSITPRVAMPGEPIVISANVKNIGEESGTHIIELLIQGEVVSSRNVSLAPGESKTIVFITSKEKTGVYKIGLDGLTGFFKVKGAVKPIKPKRVIVPIDYPTIQEAIDAANPGDVIFIKSGTYHGSITIDKSISLIGENKEEVILIGSGVGDVIRVVSDEVVISNLTVENSGMHKAGIKLDKVEKCYLSNLTIRNNYHGVYLISSNDNRIENNVMLNNSGFGIFLWSFSNNNTVLSNILNLNNVGIFVWKFSEFNIIANNTVNLNLDIGIKLHVLSNHNFISNNIVSNNNAVGIFVMLSDQNMIADNMIESNDLGILLTSISTNNIITKNTISNNGGGITLWFSSDHNRLYNNTSSNNGNVGLFAWASSNNTISINEFNLNHAGIILTGSNYNKIIRNVVMKNRHVGIEMKSGTFNVFTNNTVSHHEIYGMTLAFSDNNLISNNTFSSNKLGTWLISSNYNEIINNTWLNNGQAIVLRNSSYNKIFYNLILRNQHGIRVEWMGKEGPLGISEGNYINYNNMEKNFGYAVLNDGPIELNATFNWWGDLDGPYHPTLNPDGKGDKASDNVLFKPWLTAPIESLRAPTLKLSNLSISPTQARINETFSVSVNATNIGDLPGTFTIILKINDSIEATRDITLLGKESAIVTFKISKNVAGIYNIEVNGLKGSFLVKEIPLPTLSWEPYTIIATIAAVAIGIAAMIYRRRRVTS